MKNGKTFLAIIPARGGSKRLPDKNILNLAGKPLVAWSIESAINSKYIDRTIVSSDSDIILSIAKRFGADVIKRPIDLAGDKTSTFLAVEHILENLDKQYDYIILLQPTSPLRNSKHIDEAIEYLDKKNADAVISVCKTDHSPLWSNTLPKDKSMVGFINKNIASQRSQDLKTYYRLNGAIYICKSEKLLKNKSFFLEQNIFGFEMDRKSSIDIDEKFDFQLAEFFINSKVE